MFWARRYTMTGPVRCRALWNQCQQMLHAGIPGCFVECGVWRGGSAAIMGLAIRNSGQQRDLHLFDSFEGLPEPTERDGISAREYSGGRASGALRSVDQCRAGLEDVRALLLGRLGFEPSRVHFHAGWFQNTLPADAGRLGPIALLRLDGDWYESTRLCLEHLYPRLSAGGLIIMDDYWAWEGCRTATDEYRQANRINAPIQRIDAAAGSWIKE